MSRKRMGRIDGATPEQIAQAISAAATSPDPTKRKPRPRRKPREVQDDISYMPKSKNSD